MRSRFLLVVGEAVDAVTDALAERLRVLLPVRIVSPGQLLCLGEGTPYMDFQACRGGLVGRLFNAAGAVPVMSLSQTQQFAIASTQGRQLTEHHSGGYVAWWRRHGDGQLQVLRDPSAMQPGVHARTTGLCIVASDPDLIIASGLVERAVDWEMLGHYLRFPQLSARTTCLRGIAALIPGERTGLGGDPSFDLLWKPWSFAAKGIGTQRSQTDAARLGHTIDQAVEGWASGARTPAVELSGGLDSSILATSLARISGNWTGLTLATDAPDGDERPYARAVAAALRAPLREIVIRADTFDPLSRPTRLTAMPGGAGILRGVDLQMQALANAAGSDLVLSGTGGDNVFCAIFSSAPIIDAVRAGRLAAARRTLEDVAAVTRTTQWDVARHAARRVMRDLLYRRSWTPDDNFLSPELRPAPLPHPWLALPRQCAAGTRAHIATILRIHPVLEAHDRAATGSTVFPLLSQPVMEACLSIPAACWSAGGRDRAVARSAFSQRLPRQILERRSKGQLDTLALQAFRRDRAALAELLIDGRLAQAGLLDRRALIRQFEAHDVKLTQYHSRLLMLADAELWVRYVLPS